MPDRPCLVFIPGTLCDRRLFARQARALRGRARVLTLEYRGLRADRPWLDAALRRLPARFSLAGFSLGGLWALELLRRAPQRVERLAMIASNAEPASRVAARRGRSLWRLWAREGAATVARSLKPSYFHHPAQRRRHAALVRAMAQATPPRTARAQFDWAAQRPPGLPLLAAQQPPTLIVSGAHDRLCPRPQQQRMRDACAGSAQWVELPRCGHFIPLEQPAALTRLLAGWLQRPAAAPRTPEGACP
jgi:pimeloyl-ACP methyl ester carboxylesterase